ncbi:MAG: hypothetical protein Q4G69_01005 [Planctomycetia bacterium]|nr:hypothetical protein [Planctomycetia bacterium]
MGNTEPGKVLPCRLCALIEVALIFLLFVVYGAWPVPDVNEQYYIGKAIHFWNSGWLPADKFLDTPDSHWFYYAVFGFFSLFFSPLALAWFGRILVWFLTAWSWRSLSFAILPRRWCSLFTAAALLFYLDTFHLAGEWIIGGIEGKGFAFPLIFWGLARFFRGHYRSAWILLGFASAFHVLAGGWTVLAALFAWFLSEFRTEWNGKAKTAALKTIAIHFGKMLPALILGGLISLLGLIPALMLDANTPVEIQREAHRIYVFERLSHHLVASSLPWTFLLRFLLMSGIWILFCRLPRSGFYNRSQQFRMNGFIFAALGIMGLGLLFDFGWSCFFSSRGASAEILRFYWFRLSDWVVPFGIAFGSMLLMINSGSILFKDKQNLSRSGGILLLWFVVGILAYVPFKEYYTSVVMKQAAALTVDPNYPVPPRPVEAISFLSAIFLLALILGIFTRIRKICPSGKKILLAGIFFVSGVLAVAAPVEHFFGMLSLRTSPVVPRSNPPKDSISEGWLDICRWVKDPKNTKESSLFLVPRGCDSFKWNAHRAEIAAWKEIPQDARSIVKWFAMLEKLYAVPGAKGSERWNQPLIVLLLMKGNDRLDQECKNLGIDYIIAENPPYTISSYPEALKRYEDLVKKHLAYRNNHFTIFYFPKEENIKKNKNTGKADHGRTE